MYATHEFVLLFTSKHMTDSRLVAHFIHRCIKSTTVSEKSMESEFKINNLCLLIQHITGIGAANTVLKGTMTLSTKIDCTNMHIHSLLVS